MFCRLKNQRVPKGDLILRLQMERLDNRGRCIDDDLPTEKRLYDLASLMCREGVTRFASERNT